MKFQFLDYFRTIHGSFSFAGTLLILGIILQVLFGSIEASHFMFPVNLYVFLQLLFLTIAIWVLFRNFLFVRWLSSAKAALASISLFSVVVFIMAIVPQAPIEGSVIHKIGFNNVIYTWYYLLSVAFMLMSLGMVTLRKFLPFKGRNIPFFVIHFGLWLAMSTSILGFADRQQAMMHVHKNQLVWNAETNDDEQIELPFALVLNRFVVEYFPPKLALVNREGDLYKIPGDELAPVEGDKTIHLGNYTIHIHKFYADAFMMGDTIINQLDLPGTSVAALVSVVGREGQQWISPGSYMFEGSFMEIHPDTLLVLAEPDASYYGSEVLLYTKSGIAGKEKTIAVNAPLKAEGWDIYQHSYDSFMGKDSPYSIFMVVRDPWLPVVYAGIFLMMAGAVWLMFAKVITNSNNKEL